LRKEVSILKFAKNTQATVISCLRYRDAPVAIEWLCNTFGFEKHLVVRNVDGTIAHAQLSFGNGMTMLGSVQKDETESGRLVKQATGSKIVIDIKDEHHGGRGFSCLDLEGNLGNSGPMTSRKFAHAAFL